VVVELGEERVEVCAKKYLFVSGPLHSFVDEVGRFTKTSGSHYKVFLHPPRIVHHFGKWEVKPWAQGVFVVNGEVWISRDCVEDEKGRTYAGLRVPFGAVYEAGELYSRIVEAVLKYALSVFLSIAADGERITLTLRRTREPLSPVPIAAEGRLLRRMRDTRDYYFFEEVGVPGKYVVTLHPPRIYSYDKPLWGWELKPRVGFVLNERWEIGPSYILDLEENRWYDGIVYFGDEKLHFPASTIYNHIVESIAEYVMRKFRIPFRDGEEVTVSFASTR
jgi:hypothetical protein